MDPGIADWLSRYATKVVEVGDYRMYAIDLTALPVAPADSAVSESADGVGEPAEVEETGDTEERQEADLEQGEDEKSVPDALPKDSGETSAEKSFGAPIAEPILDPQRHGG
jgi:hypothetical protein